jgi:hypothetical protein
MVRTASETRCQPSQGRMTFDVGQIDSRSTDLVDPRIGHLRRIRFAPLACAISRGACACRRLEKLHALAVWTPARTRRPTVHACRPHGVDEKAVSAAVALEYCSPARDVVESFHVLRAWHSLHVASVAPARDSRYPALAIKVRTGLFPFCLLPFPKR